MPNLNNLFESIAEKLRDGEYVKEPYSDASSEWSLFESSEEVIPKIEDDATLFGETAQTLSAWWASSRGDNRWKEYYPYILIPNGVSIPDDLSSATLEDIVSIISPQTIETNRKT